MEDSDIDEEVLKKQRPFLDGERFSMAFFYILVSMGIGSYLSIIITALLPALKFPIYIGPMIVAAILRNISDQSKKLNAPIKRNQCFRRCYSKFIFSNGTYVIKIMGIN